MAKSDLFHVSVVTPERAVLEADARFVALPAHDGEIGILAHRAPLLVRLGIGELRAEKADGGVDRFFVDGGFAQMVENRLTVLTEQARRPEELDRRAAESAFAEARALPTRGERAFAERQAALERARQQMRLAPRS